MDEKVGNEQVEADNRSGIAEDGDAPAQSSADTTGKQQPSGHGWVVDFIEHALKETSDAFPEILQEFITKAKLGSVHHTKLLFELAGIGLSPRKRSGGKPATGPTLGQMLLDEIAKRKQVVESAAGSEANVSPAQKQDQDGEGSP